MTDPAESVDITSPIAWQRWLSIQLVRLRKAAGVKQADAAKAIGASVGKLSYLENGERPISVEELQQLLPLYDVAEANLATYVKAAEAANQTGWWDDLDEGAMPLGFKRYVGLESGASDLRSYQPTIVPGLLQTADYTAALLQAGTIPPARERVDRIITVRELRRQALTRDRNPIATDIVLDQAVLHREVGGRDVLSSQLLAMADMADTLESLTIRIIPFSAGAHAAPLGPFTILGFAWESDNGLVYIEDIVSSRYLDNAGDVEFHSMTFDRLGDVALDPDRSLSLMRHIAQGSADSEICKKI